MSSSDSEYDGSLPSNSGLSRPNVLAQYRTPSPTLPTDYAGHYRTSARVRRSVTDSDANFDEPEGRNDPPPSSFNHGSSYFGSNISQRSEHLSAGNKFENHVRSTPRKVDGVRRDIKGQPFKEHRKYLAKALGVVTEAEPTYIRRSLLKRQAGVLNASRIRTWFDNQAAALGIFDATTGRFVLPSQPTGEAQLYDYFVAIISATLNKFVVPEGSTVEREIVNTHKVKLSHLEGKHKTSPDLVVRATGSSFETSSVGTVGYENMATFIDVKLDGEINRKIHLEQLAGYVEQLFAHQPNRIFVKCLLLSEKRIRVVHFDRAGAELAPFIDLPTNPDILVRLIVSLCSTDERELGFDTSIQWSTVNGKKTSGTMKTCDLNGQEKIYNLVEPRPIAQDFDIRGRGTTLWKVSDPVEKEEFLVKQSWTSEGRPHEHLHLTRAKGIPGVCDIVGYEVLGEIQQFRCANTVFANRTGLRIIMPMYGKQVDKFKTVLEALRAVRDAVAAHEMLWQRKILHRDITNKNILLGKKVQDDMKQTMESTYGVLIDLGVALDFQDESNSNVTKEARSGSRFFQSCVILEHLTRVCIGEAPAHDYLDDLECFFYVLCFLFFLFHADGTERDIKDISRDVVKDWDSESAEHALAPKAMLFNPTRGQKRFATRIVTQTWGPACGKLFKGFLEWIWNIHQEKAELLDEYRDRLEQNPEITQNQQQSRISQDPTVRGAFASLLLQSDRHYAEILSLFDIAIAAIETTPADGAPPREALEKRILVGSTANAGPSKSSRRGSMSQAARSLQG